MYLAIISIIVFVTILVIRRILNKSITSFCKRARLEKHVGNVLRMVSNILIYAVGLSIILQAWGLPTEWFLSVSALTGAAVGFASTQTLGNFLAGLYIMITRPFEVDDYVKIGDIEGEVKEITLNYVKVYTPNYTLTEMPNRTVLNSSATVCMKENVIDYSFSMSFASKVYPSSWVNFSNLYEKIVEPAVDEFWEKYDDILPRKPEVSLSKVEHLSRTLMIRMFFPKGKAKLLYDLQPELQKIILKRLDDYREK